MQQDKKYKGMTVNERLYVSGLLDQFEKAVRAKNVERAVQILKEVELTEENIRPILENYDFAILESESKIVGDWVFENGQMKNSSAAIQIETLVKERLQKVTTDPSGRDILYLDPVDGRYWELTYRIVECMGWASIKSP
jgi:hypothetical protein